MTKFLSAAERDALKRDPLAEKTAAVTDAEFGFVTRNLAAHEKAAVIAALTQLRTEETQHVKRVARIAREPWRRSQRAQRRIEEFLDS